MDTNLQQYISQSRQQGMTDEQIRQNLLSSGWSKADINQVMSPQAVPPPPPSSPVTSPPPNVSPGSTPNQSNSTLMAALAYLGILIVVPFFTEAKNDPFVKFHLKQGLTLIIFEIGFWILSSVFGFLVAAARMPLLGSVFPLIWLFFFTLIAIGVINAAKGQTKELPVIGSFGNRFNF